MPTTADAESAAAASTSYVPAVVSTATSAASVQTALETLASAFSSVLAAVQPAPTSRAVSGIEKSKAIGSAVQAVFDRISKAQPNETKTDGEMDHLRRMVELVHNELNQEIMVRSLSEPDQTSAASQLMEQAASSEPVATATAMTSEGKSAARSNSSAYEAQKQAYRENA